MYEFGSAGAKDVEKALACYKNAEEMGFETDYLEKRIKSCKNGYPK